MPEISRFSGDCDWIGAEFVERKRTPELIMKLDLQMHLARLSLSNTISVFDKLAIQWSWKPVHDWVREADLQPEDGTNPNHVALNETVIRVNDQKYWLYAAVDPQRDQSIHILRFSRYTTALTEVFLGDLRQKHNVETAVFLGDDDKWLQTALDRHGLIVTMNCTATGMLSNISSEE